MTKLQKDTYVTKLIADSLIDLLEKNDLKDITISEITKRANVSRSSFYRNYESIEAIIRDSVFHKIRKWQILYDQTASDNQPLFNLHKMWSSLFFYLKEDQHFYMLLQERGLLYLVGEAIQNVCGPKPDNADELAFFAAFVSHGIYGWIEEWIKRDMQDEKAEKLMEQMHTFSKF